MTQHTGLRVGFIGTGWTDRVQIPAFRLGGLAPQAISSGRRENAERVAQKHGIPDVYDDWRTLVEAENVDIVSIVTPPHLHCAIAEAALRAGKHVICEKPTALNTQEAEAMLAAAQAAPGKLAIIDHELRFNPPRLHMRQMIKEGFVGSVLTVHLDRLGSDRLNPALPWTWWSDAERGGGILGAVGSHMIDLARWMMGRIDAVTAQLRTGHYYRNDPESRAERIVTADDHAHLLLRFANGALGTITASGITPGGYGMSVTVVGTAGALKLDNQDQLWSAQGDDLVNGVWQPVRVKQAGGDLDKLPNRGPFTVGSFYLAQTLAALLPQGESMLAEAASFYDGLVVQRVLDAARRSHAEQNWIVL